jgi:multidrug resistance efflux pump
MMRKLLGRLREAGGRFTMAGMLALTLGTALVLYLHGGSGGQVLGFAEVEKLDVTSTELGRVKTVQVDIGAVVHAGDVVATLDTTEIDGDIRVARAKRAQLEAAVAAGQARLVAKLDDTLGKLERSLAGAHEDQLRVGAESAAVGEEIARIRKLVDAKQATVEDLARLDLREAALEPVVKAKPATIGLLRKQIDELRRRQLDVGAETGDLQARVDLADERIRQLELRRDEHVLRAAWDGKVAEILKTPGEVVRPGQPVVQLVTTRGRVVACIPETAMLEVTEGTRARLRPKETGGQLLSGVVVARSPRVRELRPQCRTNQRVLGWGREVIVALDAPADMLAGQSFEVDFGAPVSSGRLAPASAAALGLASPAAGAGLGGSVAPLVPISVPPVLARTTRFEASGLAPEPGRQSYLLVSDDTGLDSDRLPILFRMNERGEVDPAPVPIDGVDELTDLESIAVGSGSTLYVLASQSFSRNGKRPHARTAFLALELDGTRLRVRAEVHLAELLDRAGEQALGALGLGGSTQQLDIEGLAAHEGTLYLGLKSPLDEQGRALIWAVTAPAALFEGKSLESAGLRVFARVPLALGDSTRAVAGGISELLVLPDGSAVLAATPSTGDDALGAVFRLAKLAPGEAPVPELLRRFPDRKPEGLALSFTSPDRLLVVFDNGAATPEMTEVPWH